MRERIVKRYSECIKQQVIQELENGRFSSIAAAQEHHGMINAVSRPSPAIISPGANKRPIATEDHTARLRPQKPGVRRQNSGVFERGADKGLLGETAACDQKSLRGAKKLTGCGTESPSAAPPQPKSHAEASRCVGINSGRGDNGIRPRIMPITRIFEGVC